MVTAGGPCPPSPWAPPPRRAPKQACPMVARGVPGDCAARGVLGDCARRARRLREACRAGVPGSCARRRRARPAIALVCARPLSHLSRSASRHGDGGPLLRLDRSSYRPASEAGPEQITRGLVGPLAIDSLPWGEQVIPEAPSSPRLEWRRRWSWHIRASTRSCLRPWGLQWQDLEG